MSERTFATVGVGEDDLVTGEAVALDLPSASVGIRVLAAIIDAMIVQFFVYALLFGAIWLTRNADRAAITATSLVAVVIGLTGYPIVMETRTRGRTVGHLACGLRVLRDDAGPITFRHAMTRALIGVVEKYLLYGIPAILACVLSPRGKRLGDMAAGTFVVRERVTATIPPPVPMPSHLAQWAAAADIGRLPDSLALEVRTFLPAAFTLDPTARAELGRQLLDEVMTYVAPPPPRHDGHESHPEYVLAAVLAERRSRDLDKLVRDAHLRDRVIPLDPVTARDLGAQEAAAQASATPPTVVGYGPGAPPPPASGYDPLGR